MKKASMLISKIKSNRVVANILKMLTGTAMGQVISIIMVPLTSRIYGAEFYGDLAVFNSAAAICASVVGFGLASAIMVEKTDAEAMQTYKLAVDFTNVLIFAAAMIALLLSPYVRFLKSSLPYGLVIVLLAFYVTTVNRINMLYAWLNRKGKYNVMLFNPIIGPLVNNVLCIGLGLMGFTHFGLYVGLIASQFFTLMHMYRNMDPIDYRLRLEDIRLIVRRNRDFILYQYPASFLNSVVGNVPLQVLSLCFSNTVVGYYSMAVKLLSAPTNMIASAMSRVYFKEATDMEHSGGSARAYTLKLCRLAMSTILILLLGILVLGDWAIPLFLGADWAPAVSYLKIMAIWMLFAISTSCTSGFPSVIGKQKTNMIMALTKLCVFPVVMLGVSRLYGNPLLTLLVYTIACSVINTGYYEALIGSDRKLRFQYTRMAAVIGVIVAVLYIAQGVLRGGLL